MSIADALRRARLLLATARHLTASQIAARAARTARMRLLRLRGATLRPAANARFAPHVPLWSSDAAHAPGADARLDRARRLAGAEPLWNNPALTRLSRYHLHYFEIIEDLAVQAWRGERDVAYDTFRRLVRSWLASNRRIGGDGWHPYTVSLRCANWCHAASVFAPELARDPVFASELAGSTFAQLRFLFRNIERDVRGNHIIENLRALLIGGIAFAGAEPAAWHARALRMLQREVAEQVLADGGHFERVPAYHVVVARDFLEIALWLRRNRQQATWLEDAVARMLGFLDAIIMADGRLPLLKDTTYDGLDPHELLAAGAIFFGEGRWKRRDEGGFLPGLLFGDAGARAYAALPLNEQPRATTFLPQSGYAVMRPSSRHSLIVDAGRPCPDYLPAHAHADMFSFELCLDGRRVVVDSGVYTYEAGPWRDHFRSTRAHNTVEVAGEDQSEVWSSFRVGRRATPRLVRFEESTLHAEHDGYERLAVPVRHRRTLACSGGEIIVTDELIGEGEVAAKSYLHFHPDCDPPSISTFGADSELWSESWYSERFGEKRPNRVLVLTKRARLPFAFGYAITLGSYS